MSSFVQTEYGANNLLAKWQETITPRRGEGGLVHLETPKDSLTSSEAGALSLTSSNLSPPPSVHESGPPYGEIPVTQQGADGRIYLVFYSPNSGNVEPNSSLPETSSRFTEKSGQADQNFEPHSSYPLHPQSHNRYIAKSPAIDGQGNKGVKTRNHHQSTIGKGTWREKRIQELQERDREVRQHELSHLAMAGPYAKSPPIFVYEIGPDGRAYAVGGHVLIDTQPEEEPERTILKMRMIRQAALSVSSPSGKDVQVVAQTLLTELAAQAELARRQLKLIEASEEFNSSVESIRNRVSFINPGIAQLGSDPFTSRHTPLLKVMEDEAKEKSSPSSIEDSASYSPNEPVKESTHPLYKRMKLIKSYQQTVTPL